MGVELFAEAIALLFGGVAARWMFTQVRARAQEWIARRQLEALASEPHIVEPLDTRPPTVLVTADSGKISAVSGDWEGAVLEEESMQSEVNTHGPTATDLIWRGMGFGLFTPRPRVISSAEPGSGRRPRPLMDALAFFLMLWRG